VGWAAHALVAAVAQELAAAAAAVGQAEAAEAERFFKKEEKAEQGHATFAAEQGKTHEGRRCLHASTLSPTQARSASPLFPSPLRSQPRCQNAKKTQLLYIVVSCWSAAPAHVHCFLAITRAHRVLVTAHVHY